MSATIWKYPLRLSELQDIEMPVGAHILHVAEQFGTLCMWAIVDPLAEKRPRRFAIVGTGHPAPDDVDTIHVGSAVCDGGRFVWHVFERSGNP